MTALAPLSTTEVCPRSRRAPPRSTRRRHRPTPGRRRRPTTGADEVMSDTFSELMTGNDPSVVIVTTIAGDERRAASSASTASAASNHPAMRSGSPRPIGPMRSPFERTCSPSTGSRRRTRTSRHCSAAPPATPSTSSPGAPGQRAPTAFRSSMAVPTGSSAAGSHGWTSTPTTPAWCSKSWPPSGSGSGDERWMRLADVDHIEAGHDADE